jgi:hypothetical protein
VCAGLAVDEVGWGDDDVCGLTCHGADRRGHVRVSGGPLWAADSLEECLMALVVVMIHSEHLGAGYYARAEL